jgi:hypothetical protein
MRRTILLLCLTGPALAGAATSALEGRWEGPVQIPGRELPLVVDLARDDAGAWAGSIVVPGLGLKGAPLANVAVAGAAVAFDLGSALADPTGGTADFSARLTPDALLVGEMKQGGLAAPFTLHRSGAAQVERAPRSTPVGPGFADRWVGEFELGGYPRRVTLTVEAHAGAAATATLVVVGKQTTNVPVDLVREDGEFLRVEAQATRVAFEGRLGRDRNELRGSVELGPLELPVVLRRAAGRPS